MENTNKLTSDAEPDASFRMVVFEDETIIRYDGDETTIVQQIFNSLKRKPSFNKALSSVIFQQFLNNNLN